MHRHIPEQYTDDSQVWIRSMCTCGWEAMGWWSSMPEAAKGFRSHVQKYNNLKIR